MITAGIRSAGADQGAAADGVAAAGAEQGAGKTRCGHDGCDQQRHHRRRQIIADRKARHVGQHGDEVGRPYPPSRHDAGGRQPGQAIPALDHARALQQVDGRETRQQTHATRQQKQPNVMLVLKTVQYAKHAIPLQLQPTMAAGLFPIIKICAGVLRGAFTNLNDW